jgi:hypothetical protein
LSHRVNTYLLSEMVWHGKLTADYHMLITCSWVSGDMQHSGLEARFHFTRFFRVGRELFIYWMVKMKMFFGSLDWAADQRALNCDRENLIVTCEKKEPFLRKSIWEWKFLSTSFCWITITVVIMIIISMITMIMIMIIIIIFKKNTTMTTTACSG